MTDDAPDPEDVPDANLRTITGRCDHCDWEATAESHAEMVRRYQDHLRAEHPDAWLRA